MIMETIKNKIQEWKDRKYLKGLTRVELTIDYEKFKNAMIKTGKALSKFGWCFCPRCGAYSSSDFSFCPTCACPKKSRLVKLNDFEACPWCGAPKSIDHKHCTNLICEYDEEKEK